MRHMAAVLRWECPNPEMQTALWPYLLLILYALCGLITAFPISRAIVEDAEAALPEYRQDAELQRLLRLHRKRRQRHRANRLEAVKEALVSQAVPRWTVKLILTCTPNCSFSKTIKILRRYRRMCIVGVLNITSTFIQRKLSVSIFIISWVKCAKRFRFFFS